MRTAPLVSLSLLLLAGLAFSDDSPQFRGTNRDGKFIESGLMKQWPEGGPPVAWVAKGMGAGFSSASVVQGKIYVPGMFEEDNGYVSVLNADGTLDKKTLYGKETLDKQAPGSRSTPTLDGDRLYILSGLGVVYCLDHVKGQKLWEVNILERFKGQNNQWTLAESLLVDGDRVICTPGGPDAGIAALNKMTGETVWTTKGFSDQASYCSPIIANHNGRRILLTGTAKVVVGIDVDSGALLWTHDHIVDYDIHGVTPIYDRGLVFYTGGSYSGGASGALELSPDGSSVTVKWTDKNLDCLHHGVVLVDGYLYGTSYKKTQLVCLEMATGKLMWTSREVRLGVVVFADGMLYVYEGPKTGIVSLIKPSPTAFDRTGSFTVTEGDTQHWAHPTISNGKLYIRHGDALIAYDIAQK